MSHKTQPVRNFMQRLPITWTRKWTDLWECYWFGPVAAIRPYLLMKAALLLLAFDMWLLRTVRGSRIGVFEFNVAHFPLLDAIHPVPTPEHYISVALSVGILALVITFAGAVRWALLLLALGYTYTWAISMTDMFQHHYFVSLVLIAFIFFPISNATEIYPTVPPAKRKRPQKAKHPNATRPSVSAWGYRLLAANMAIVYIYTAVTKLSEQEFIHGDIVKRLTRSKPYLRTVETWFADFNIDTDLFYQLTSLGVIGLQLFLAIAYLLTVRLDEGRSRWLRVVAWFGLIGAIGFHGVGNELLAHLKIGWFSYYMIALACIYFLPAPILWSVGGLLTWPVRSLVKLQAKIPEAVTKNRVFVVGVSVGGFALAVGAFFVGFHLDLPGGEAVGLLVAVGLASASVVSLFLRRQPETMKYFLASALAVGIMWVTITQSMVRSDYYTVTAKYKRYEGNLDAAIKDIEKAILYVPTGRKNEGKDIKRGNSKDLRAGKIFQDGVRDMGQ